MKKKLKYTYVPTTPALYVEIYIPKKALYQSILYNSLSDGFDIKKVKEHFQRTQKNKTRLAEIQQLLSKYRPEEKFANAVKNLNRLVNAGGSIYYGYTMYEVDGVFYDPAKGVSREKGRIYEERTQVLRLVFIPDFEPLYKKIKSGNKKFKSEKDKIKKAKNSDDIEKTIRRVVTEYLRIIDTTSKKDFIRRIRKRIGDLNNADVLNEGLKLLSDDCVKEIVNYLDDWIKDVEIFVLGYLIYNYTTEISEKYTSGEIKFDQIEKQIWCTSFWNFNVTRIVCSNPPRVRETNKTVNSSVNSGRVSKSLN